MNFKLACRNILNNFREYKIYFFTIILSVSVFYVFNSIESQKLMMNYKFNNNDILSFVEGYLEKASFLVSIIIGFLLIYANNFLIKRRKKEIKIYSIIGMKKYQICSVIFIETFIIGVISLVFGLIIGVLLSQGLSIITAKLFDTNIVKFKFIFSFKAFKSTLLCFGVIYIISFIFNIFFIGNLRFTKLIKNRKKDKNNNSKKNIFLFLLSIALVISCYHLLIIDKIYIDNQTLISICLGILGTGLFFYSLPKLIISLAYKNKKVYFKNLNIVLFRDYEKNNNSFIMAVICIFSTAAIIIFFTGIGISNAIKVEMNEVSKYDNFIWYPGDLDIKEFLRNRGIDISDYSNSEVNYKTYDSGFSYGYLLGENEIKDKKIHPVKLFYYNHFIIGDTVPIMKVSDFNKLLIMNGKEAIELKEKEYAIFSDISNSYSKNELLLYENTPLLVNGIILHPSSKELYNIITYNSLQRSNIATLVVPDYLVEDLPVLNSFLNVQYKRDMVSVDEVFYKNITPHIRVGNTKVLFTTKEEVHLFEPSVRVVVSYTAVYIGIILLLTSTAILSLKQLTYLVDAKDEINIIKRLGGDYGMIYKTILLRTLWEYILPLFISLIHSYIGIKAISNIIASDITTSSLFSILFIVLMFFIFYGFYYLLTYFNGKRILKEIYI